MTLSLIEFRVTAQTPDQVEEELDGVNGLFSETVPGEWECVFDVLYKDEDQIWHGIRKFSPVLPELEETQLSAEGTEVEQWPYRGDSD